MLFLSLLIPLLGVFGLGMIFSMGFFVGLWLIYLVGILTIYAFFTIKPRYMSAVKDLLLSFTITFFDRKVSSFINKFKNDRDFRIFIYFAIGFFCVTRPISIFIRSLDSILLSLSFLILCILLISIFRHASEFKSEKLGFKQVLLNIFITLIIYLIVSVIVPGIIDFLCLKDLFYDLFDFFTIFSILYLNLEDFTLNMNSGSSSNNPGDTGNSNYNGGSSGGPEKPNYNDPLTTSHSGNNNGNNSNPEGETTPYVSGVEKELSSIKQSMSELDNVTNKRISDLYRAEYMVARGCTETALRCFRSATQGFNNDTLSFYNRIVDLNDLASTAKEKSLASDCFDLNQNLDRKMNYYLGRAGDIGDKVRTSVNNPR